MTIKGIFDTIKKREVCYKVARKIFRFYERRKPDLQIYAKDYIFDNRSKGADNLLMVVLGFQPYYWDVALERVMRNVDQFDEAIDVCLCVPCGANADSRGGAKLFAEKYKFSLLYIKDDLLAQVQNTAILLHPIAKWIFKIDEDIILSDNYFSKMKRAYTQAEKNQLCKIGYVSPVLNVNDYGSMVFINSIGAMKEYESKFGVYSITAGKGKVFKDKDVATWIWEKSIPFDDVAARLEFINNGKISESNYRVRIGAILFTREFVEQMGMFKVAGLEVLGTEELELCAYCMNWMYRIVIAEDVLCGHLGFSHQKQACREFFEEHINEIKHK